LPKLRAVAALVTTPAAAQGRHRQQIERELHPRQGKRDVIIGSCPLPLYAGGIQYLVFLARLTEGTQAA
jgi:hypothetical protein